MDFIACYAIHSKEVHVPRIEPLTAPYEREIEQQFERVMPPGEPPLLLFRTVATSERAWRKFRAGSLLSESPLGLRERELVIDRTCARAGCEYEWGVHVAFFADAARLTAEEVAATLRVPAAPEDWPEREAALIAAVDALHERARLSDAEFERLQAHYDDTQILEVLMLAGFYRTVSYLCNGLALPLEQKGARFADHGAGAEQR
jgi:alkylhydroperoxidase family enzyme